MLFDSFEAYDVQETRKVRKAEGQQLKLITQVCKKIQKNMSVPDIAEMLEETPDYPRQTIRCFLRAPSGALRKRQTTFSICRPSFTLQKYIPAHLQQMHLVPCTQFSLFFTVYRLIQQFMHPHHHSQ